MADSQATYNPSRIGHEVDTMGTAGHLLEKIRRACGQVVGISIFELYGRERAILLAFREVPKASQRRVTETTPPSGT